jgi:hydroxyacylglutathione hydrolase
MLQIKQFRYLSDNFGYLLYGQREALAIDGGAVEDILDFMAERGLKLRAITNTHAHHDHLHGNSKLASCSQAPTLFHTDLARQGVFSLEGEDIAIYATPGHTIDSVCFHCGDGLISGDTLFNGTVGNCFSGDMSAFFHSIKKIMQLPPQTQIYAGHDYVRLAMVYARQLEPNNPAIETYLQKYDQDLVVSSLADELLVNPYLRFNEPSMIEVLREKDLPHATEWERWQALME